MGTRRGARWLTSNDWRDNEIEKVSMTWTGKKKLEACWGGKSRLSLGGRGQEMKERNSGQGDQKLN